MMLEKILKLSKRLGIIMGGASLVLLVVGIFFCAKPALCAQEGVTAQSQTESANTVSKGLAMIGAALATGLATVGAGIAVGSVGSAAMGAVAEKPELMAKTFIYIGLAEGIAIYGLLISIMIFNKF